MKVVYQLRMTWLTLQTKNRLLPLIIATVVGIFEKVWKFSRILWNQWKIKLKGMEKKTKLSPTHRVFIWLMKLWFRVTHLQENSTVSTWSLINTQPSSKFLQIQCIFAWFISKIIYIHNCKKTNIQKLRIRRIRIRIGL